MSTRSIIAIPEGDGWKGRYVHYDGYPTGVGQTVWHIVKTAGLAEAARILTSKPIGWSGISDNPDGTPPINPGYDHEPGYGYAYIPEDDTEDWWIHSTDTDKSWCEWYYILADNGLWVGTLDGADYTPHHIAIIPWGGDEPDWYQIQALGVAA